MRDGIIKQSEKVERESGKKVEKYNKKIERASGGQSIERKYNKKIVRENSKKEETKPMRESILKRQRGNSEIK